MAKTLKLDPATTVDAEYAALRTAGYTGTLNDMQYAYLRAQLYDNSLTDMLKEHNGAGVV